jgi:peroxiredoxin
MGDTRPSSGADPVAAGEPAPDFTLPSGPGETLSLDALRGRPAVLAFYPGDWSPVCSDQLDLYQSALPRFEGRGARLVGISVDSVWCHAAFAEDRGLGFPLLADFEPKGEVARAYGVYREDDGIAERALFVLDPEGVVRWSHVSPPDVVPGADGVLEALDGLADDAVEGDGR